jgi:hypothetical protein
MTEISGTTSSAPVSPPTSARPSFKDFAADAIRYWETRRVFYNVALGLVVLGHFVSNWPGSRSVMGRDAVLGFFLLAVLANICYCAAYVVDLFVQFSGVRGAWPRWRWLVLTTGTAFAAVIAHFIAMAFFSPGAD